MRLNDSHLAAEQGLLSALFQLAVCRLQKHTGETIMRGLVVPVVLTALLESAGATAASHELYDNVVPADTADCLEKVGVRGGACRSVSERGTSNISNFRF